MADRITRGGVLRPHRTPVCGPTIADAPSGQQIADARAALAAHPDDPRALFRLAAILLQTGHPDAATLLPQLDRHDDFASGWLAIGDVLLRRHRTNAALAAITRGLRALPAARLPPAQLGAAHALHARALRAADRDPEAATAFATALRIHPDQPETWYGLALLQQDHRAHAAAAAAYRRALSLRPDFHEAALNLGVALGECGELDPALDAYALALTLRPDSFGRIAQALVSGRTGLLVLDPARLRALLADRAPPV